MPKLLIDATPVRADAKGVGRYAYNVCLQLAERLPQDWEMHALVYGSAHDLFPQGFRGTLVSVRQASEIVHGAFTLTHYANKLQPDILLKTLESAGHVGVPTVTICHDIDALILAAQKSRRLVFRRCIDACKYSLRRRALRKSEFVICNSQFTCTAVQRHYNIPPAGTAVAYCAVDPRFYEISLSLSKEKILKRYGVRNFVVTFATGDTRENFDLLPGVAHKLQTLEVPVCLLVAGTRLAAPYAKELRARFQELGLVEGKHFLLESFLDADRFEDLVGLYTAADFYLDLSLHEGFGMQLAEAMACGTTCVTSPNGALTEVSGGHAIFIDPTSADNVASVLKTSYDAHLHLRDNQAQVAYTRKFSWDEMGKIVTEVLLNLAHKKSST